jgi:hypothetical protein
MNAPEETVQQFLKRTQREKKNARERERRRMIRESDPIIQSMKAKKEEEKEKKISANFSKMLDKAKRKAEKPEREKKKRAEKMGKELLKTLNPKRKGRFVKGSQEAKDYMASIRKMKK